MKNNLDTPVAKQCRALYTKYAYGHTYRVENLVAFVAFLVKSCDFQFSLSDKMRRAILCDLAKLEILT